MANHRPPWVVYQSFMAGQLIGIDKEPGVRSVGVGETCFRMVVKCVLSVAGTEAKYACGMEKFCILMEAIIEGGFHAMWMLCHQLSQ